MRRSQPPKAKREKRCKSCRQAFKPSQSTQVVCSPNCALAWARKQERLRAKKAAKEQRAKHRAERERLKPKSKVMAEAQTAFNAFIRLRDEGHPCISCGVNNLPEKYGGSWDCGHYLTRGAHPELRFEELNAHRQCKSCNGGAGKWSRKSHTVQQDYRINLIDKIGLAAVEWLEGPHEPKRYRIDDLREIKALYQKKRRELK